MYLLLRNNKQSGPYSLEELKSMGLKAYDLVWLEGKSAAWRYPCEIEELSAFAPPVEEQPFDRFYKRPSAASSVAASNSASSAAASASTSLPPLVPAATPASATPQYTGEPSAVPGKRIIYVTMPAGRTQSPVREIFRETVRETPKEPVRQTQTAQAPAMMTGAPDPAHLAYASGSAGSVSRVQVDSRVAHAGPGIEDYSSQLPSLEEQLVEISPRTSLLGASRHDASLRGSSKSRTTRIFRPLAIGACILALLAAGIFIGLSLNRENLGFQQKIAAGNPAGNVEQPIVHSASQPLPLTTAAVTPAPPGKHRDSVPNIVSQASAAVSPVSKPPHVTTPPKERPASPKKGMTPPVTKDSAAAAMPVVHREAIHRDDAMEKGTDNNTDKEAAKTAIARQVTVGANSYIVGTFGGINGLQLTVTNHSAYPIDLVVVEVQYIQANKKVHKTENLYFRNISAGSALMLEAPKSSRGVKVQYKITTISSKELGISYSGI